MLKKIKIFFISLISTTDIGVLLFCHLTYLKERKKKKFHCDYKETELTPVHLQSFTPKQSKHEDLILCMKYCFKISYSGLLEQHISNIDSGNNLETAEYSTDSTYSYTSKISLFSPCDQESVKCACFVYKLKLKGN